MLIVVPYNTGGKARGGRLELLRIVKLDEIEATLDPFLLRQLLADDDPKVARYSLGLISLSAEREVLIKEAMTATHANDPAFHDDLEMLRDILSK